MTKEQMLRAVLEWAGWKAVPAWGGAVVWYGRWEEGNPQPVETATCFPPLTLDLCAALEAKLCDTGNIKDPNHPRYRYAGNLYRLCPEPMQPCRANKEQRLTALYKTIQKESQ